MDVAVIVLVVSFVTFLLMNVPIAVSIAMATFCTMMVLPEFGMEATSKLIATKMATGIDGFPLLAIPFFILSGLFMGKGGIARRLIAFADSIVGRFTGGLGHVNVMTCMMFGAISGSAAAAVSSVGGFMIPEMNEQDYDRDYNVAVTTTAATTGLMIPPSNVMIVYAVVTGTVSIAAMFIAGIIPGVIVGLGLMIVNAIISKKRGYGGGEKASFKLILTSFWHAGPSLLLIIIVLGGILTGYCTPTEAAAIAVAYSFVLAVIAYREVKIKDIPGLLLQCGITTSIVMLLIGASTGMSWIMTLQNIPQNVSAALLSISDNRIVIFMIINVLLLFVGTFMDMTPAVLIFTPIFLPVVEDLGMHRVHFGIMMIANLCIGLCTPPVGTCLFVGCGIGKTTIAKVTGSLLPFFAAMVIALLLITYIEDLSLFLPSLLWPQMFAK